MSTSPKLKRTLHVLRRFLWMCTVGFMIAIHNAFFHDDRLREEDRIELTQLEEDDEKEEGDPGRDQVDFFQEED